MIPIEDLTDVTLAIQDTDNDDEGDEGFFFFFIGHLVVGSPRAATHYHIFNMD